MPTEAGATALIEHPLPRGDAARAKHLETWRQALPPLATRLGASGSLLLVARNGYEDGTLVPWPYQLADEVRPRLSLKNVYARLAEPLTDDDRPLADAHELCFFFVGSQKEYVFDKAPLRQPHVFKDLEWGKRTVGPTGYHDKSRTSQRYPEGGRDPGNVFYTEERAPDGSVMAIRPTPRAEVYLKLVLACSKPGWTIVTNLAEEGFDKRVEAEGRRVEWA